LCGVDLDKIQTSDLYKKKKKLFFAELVLSGFSFSSDSRIALLFDFALQAQHWSFPMCEMQEGNKACKISGCALQDNITVSLWTGKLKLEMIRDYVQFKSIESLLV